MSIETGDENNKSRLREQKGSLRRCQPI